MSLPDLDSNEPRGVLVRRPRSSIYTVMLLVSLLALTLGCLLLVLELWRYGFEMEPTAGLSPRTVTAQLDVRQA